MSCWGFANSALRTFTIDAFISVALVGPRGLASRAVTESLCGPWRESAPLGVMTVAEAPGGNWISSCLRKVFIEPADIVFGMCAISAVPFSTIK